VTRSKTSAPSPSDLAAKDPAKDPMGAVLAILRVADAPMVAGAIKQLLIDDGVEPAIADRVWKSAQGRIRRSEYVIYVNKTYQWTAAPREITAQELAEARRRVSEAEERIVSLEREISRLSTARPDPADTPQEAYERAERRRAARERQARIDAMSTVAELAAEVEELTAKRAAPEVLLEHTRALTGGRGLEAIGRAGEKTAYDETSHEPVGDFPDQGEAVIVIRPGYLWHAPGEAVLISKALVTRE
jgi:hypothetical protein